MLENDLSVDNMKETTASQAQRISPFKDSPLAIFKDILSDCCHICGSEFSHEHSSDSIDSHNRIICYLMVHSLVMIETYDCFYVVAVEGINPFAHNFFWPQHVLPRSPKCGYIPALSQMMSNQTIHTSFRIKTRIHLDTM